MGAALGVAGAPAAAAESDAGWHLPASIVRWLSSSFRQLDDRQRALQAELATLPAAPEVEPGSGLGWRIFDYFPGRPWRGEAWIELDFGEDVSFDAVVIVPAHLAMPDYAGPGFGFPSRFRVEAATGGGASAVLADHSREDFPHPGNLPVWIDASGRRARRVRVSITQPWFFGDNLHACALAEIMVLDGARNLATGRTGVVLRTSDSRESPPEWTRSNLVDGQSPLGAPTGAWPEDPPAIGHCWHSRFARAPNVTKWVQVDLGRVVAVDEVRLVPARLPQRNHREGYGFPPRFRIEAADTPDFAQPRLIVDHTRERFLNPGFNVVTFPAGLSARFLRVTATELHHHGDGQYAFALAELQAYAGSTNLARGARVEHLDNLEASPNWRAAFLTDGARWEHALAEWPAWLRGLSRRRELRGELDRIDVQLAALRATLSRTSAWIFAGLLVAAALAVLATYYRVQLRRSRETDALRRRIAADLHDDLGSNLASIALLSEMCLQSPQTVPRSDLAELHALARETAGALRDATWFIRPDSQAPGQFLERLRATARRLLVGVTWTFDTGGFSGEIALDAQRHLLLALKEALHNVVRHAGARQVGVRLSSTDDTFTLEVTDDGCGFAPGAVAEGQGFASLRHRAGLLGGEARITSQPGRGATVTFTGRRSPPGAPPLSR